MSLSRKRQLLVLPLAWALISLACGQSAPPAPTTTPSPAPTYTPAPPQPTATLADASVNFQELGAYAQALDPLLREAQAATERDSAILQQFETNPEAICGGAGIPHPTFVEDAVKIRALHGSLVAMTPPAVAVEKVHAPLTNSADLWAKALENINKSCVAETPAERDLLRAGAALQMNGAMLNFVVAYQNYWRLVWENGLEAFTGEPPPGAAPPTPDSITPH